MKSVQNTGKRSFMPVVSVQPDSLPKAGWMKTVFCKTFLHKIAETFCRSLQLHFVGNCKPGWQVPCQSYKRALQTFLYFVFSKPDLLFLAVDLWKCFIDAGFPQPIIDTRKQDQFYVMGQSADQCGCHPLVVKDIHPLGKLQVCIHVNFRKNLP